MSPPFWGNWQMVNGTRDTTQWAEPDMEGVLKMQYYKYRTWSSLA